MAVNTAKTKYLIFHTKGKQINMGGKQILFNENVENAPQLPQNIYPLERIHLGHHTKSLRTYKLLGIHLDENLTFDTNTNFLITKLAKSIHCINKVKIHYHIKHYLAYTMHLFTHTLHIVLQSQAAHPILILTK